MLTPHELEAYFATLGTPASGQRLVMKARINAPVREVRSRSSNVITYLASRKMNREIATESRQAEYTAALLHETDPGVLEFYPQPCTLKCELIDEDTGEVHALDHTPDFLVLRDDQIVLQEWKIEDKLQHLARRFPWRYQKRDGQWRSPQIEAYVAQYGIVYELHSHAEIHPNRIKNLEALRSYLLIGAPQCPKSLIERLRIALSEHGVLNLRELLSPDFNFTADELNQAIAASHLTCDLDAELLSNPDRFLVYRDRAFMQFMLATNESVSSASHSFTFPFKPNVRFNYEGRTLEILFLTDRDIHYREDQDSVIKKLSKDWVLLAQSKGEISHIHDPSEQGTKIGKLLNHNAHDLAQGQHRAQLLAMPFDPDTTPCSHSTYYRLKSLAATAIKHQEPETLALIPQHCRKGNRKPRLTPAQIDAMKHIRITAYLTTRSPNAKSVYRDLKTYCTNQSIRYPSYPTFLHFLKTEEDNASRLVRGGKRNAYQLKRFHYSLSYDTPKHGDRPFWLGHIDHTLVDVELKHPKTGESLGRPWLSILLDAYSRRVLALFLGFHPPDRSTVLMLLRAAVKRWGRLPDMVMTDNGKDLISNDVKQFLSSMQVDFRLRPAGQPRAGAVLERLFGTLNTQLLHNLDGNTELTKNVRSLSGSHLPKRLSLWTLEHLYSVIDYWAFTFYDQAFHTTLGMSPRETFEQGLKETGARAHQAIAYNRDFLIATCPSVNRGGVRTVDRQRGVKVNNFYYESPQFDSMLLVGKSLPVRYDPHDISRVFVQLPNNQWVDAHSMQLRHLPRINMRQLHAISAEYMARRKRGTGAPDLNNLSATQLSEFVATMSPDSDTYRQAQRSAETERLLNKQGLLNLDSSESQTKMFGFDALQHAARTQTSGRAVPSKKPVQHPTDANNTSGASPGDASFIYGDLD